VNEEQPNNGAKMSAWPGKYVIGLTGNIATGKSVVRKMLEHLGAYGIDADALAHRAIAYGAPGYKPVIETFGSWIVGDDRQIDRSRLGRIVFTDPQALEQLEAIVHPLVRQAVDILVRRSKQTVIVIEAIKLLESPLRQAYDTLFVTYTPPELQLERLVQKRGMTEETARQRITAQTAQEQKIGQADIVIRNVGSFEDTWRQVMAAWQKAVPASTAAILRPALIPPGKVMVVRARPQDAKEIASFMVSASPKPRYQNREAVMAAFGEKAFLLLKSSERIIGLAGWQVENLVARTDDVNFKPSLPLADGMRMILEEVEKASRDLQCEVSLLFLPPHLARKEEIWRNLGYEKRTIQSLGVRAWQEAAVESMPNGTIMLFKQLRKDRVLRPV
jgi:dephospho-CoA kinase